MDAYKVCIHNNYNNFLRLNGELLFTVFARIKDPKDVDDVRDQVLATFKRFAKETASQQKLEATRSRLRYSTALMMNSSEAIARAIAPYVALRRTPETINKLFEIYQSLMPEDIRAAASRYYVDNNRTVVTLTSKQVEGSKAEK